MAKRVNRTGRHRSVKAPQTERLERHCPHLAFISPERFDRVVQKLDERNARYRRKGENGRDSRANVPKKRTTWPGQHLYCGICGRMFVYGGHGQKHHLMCRGAKDYKCWQAITVDGPLASKVIRDAVICAIESLPEFDENLLDSVNSELKKLATARGQELISVERALVDVDRKIENLLRFIRDGNFSDAITADLNRLESEKRQLDQRREEAQSCPRQLLELPSIDEIKSLAKETIHSQLDSPQEFGRMMRRFIPKIIVYPYRLCDGGHIVLRAWFTLTLATFVADVDRMQPVCDSLEKQIELNLFDHPQREMHRQFIVGQRTAGRKEMEIATDLGITRTAVQRAAALQRRMENLRIDDPYLPVTAPPEDYKKLRRHRHRRYHFEPLNDK